MKILQKEFEKANTFSELFELVKIVVKESLNMERTGLMLSLSELGVQPNGFVGGYHPVGSNVIVMNKTATDLVDHVNPEISKAYRFHILLHEYLHTLGILDEENVRAVAYVVSKKAFGGKHPVTMVSARFGEILKGMSYDIKPRSSGIEIVNDFDISNVSYIG
ncbi:hypothetical protein EPN87_03775 [archaeon]|nr:MAG: hypothetical protein EPN87_03775 [archaeon]